MSIPIQRLYNSPNCVLSLQGFSDENSSTQSTPVMSVLTVAQCQIMNQPHTLSGGVSFVNNLVKAVSAYGQQCLSGLTHPEELEGESDYIFLQKLPEKNRHLLVWQEKKDHTEKEIKLELSTIQLFDLLETIDQLCADPMTLPQITTKLNPVSRRYRQMEVSLVEQSAPVAFGLTGFALSALLLFLMPYPQEINDPNLQPAPPPVENIEE